MGWEERHGDHVGCIGTWQGVCMSFGAHRKSLERFKEARHWHKLIGVLLLF